MSNKIGELKYEIVPLNQIKENYDKSPPILIFGDKKYGNYFKHNFIEIDDFLTETKSYSFTIDDIEKLLKVLKCYQR
ncbi:MAG: hypothetical protein NTY95_07495 [Bacteroidia bacterium]|nr:hypothetical protein [Bacteroidia bacterium]